MIDKLKSDWLDILKEFPPLLTPKQAENASGKVISRQDIYNHGSSYKRQLGLDIRRIGGRLFVTRESLLDVLCGEQVRPL